MFISPARTITGLLFHKWSLANSFTSESERHVFFFFFFFSLPHRVGGRRVGTSTTCWPAPLQHSRATSTVGQYP
jgi:hypothetical protein